MSLPQLIAAQVSPLHLWFRSLPMHLEKQQCPEYLSPCIHVGYSDTAPHPWHWHCHCSHLGNESMSGRSSSLCLSFTLSAFQISKTLQKRRTETSVLYLWLRDHKKHQWHEWQRDKQSEWIETLNFLNLHDYFLLENCLHSAILHNNLETVY